MSELCGLPINEYHGSYDCVAYDLLSIFCGSSNGAARSRFGSAVRIMPQSTFLGIDWGGCPAPVVEHLCYSPLAKRV